MNLSVSVHVEGDTAPPQGSAVIVQVRDTSLADAAAVIVAEVRTASEAPQPADQPATGDRIGSVEIELEEIPTGATVWAHVDVDASGGVSEGDYLTTQSYPLPADADEAAVAVAVRRI